MNSRLGQASRTASNLRFSSTSPVIARGRPERGFTASKASNPSWR
ncbi:MAG: hypothetical protein ACFCBU_17065 [Cyanophyceae cyanobacterium]